jgi:hypothetical protein
MSHRVVWFDIPVLDLERAIEFYSQVLGIRVSKDIPGMSVAVLQHGENEVSGCLFETDLFKPSADGVLVYLSVEGRLEDAVAKVEQYGGRVIRPPHEIGPYGHRAIVLDSEGNRIALHER